MIRFCHVLSDKGGGIGATGTALIVHVAAGLISFTLCSTVNPASL